MCPRPREGERAHCLLHPHPVRGLSEPSASASQRSGPGRGDTEVLSLETARQGLLLSSHSHHAPRVSALQHRENDVWMEIEGDGPTGVGVPPPLRGDCPRAAGTGVRERVRACGLVRAARKTFEWRRCFASARTHVRRTAKILALSPNPDTDADAGWWTFSAKALIRCRLQAVALIGRRCCWHLRREQAGERIS